MRLTHLVLVAFGTLIAASCTKTTRNQSTGSDGTGGDAGAPVTTSAASGGDTVSSVSGGGGGSTSATSGGDTTSSASGGGDTASSVSGGGDTNVSSSADSGGTTTAGGTGTTDGGETDTSGTGGTGATLDTSTADTSTADTTTADTTTSDTSTTDSTTTDTATVSTTGGGTGGTGSVSTWCDTQVRPAEVAEADFGCADFDTGMPADWTLADTGSHLTITEAVAKSPSASLDLQAPGLAAASNVSTLSWSTVGAAAVTLAQVSLSVNPTAQGGIVPPYDTFIEIACLYGGDGRACVNYTEEGPVDGNVYTGFFLKWTMSSGPPVFAEFPVGTATNNLWTDITLSMEPGGDLVATVGASSVTVDNMGVPATTAITAIVGGYSRYGDSGPYHIRMDDVVVSVWR